MIYITIKNRFSHQPKNQSSNPEGLIGELLYLYFALIESKKITF